MSSIVDEYIAWLNRYISKKGYYAQLAVSLASELETVETIFDLESALAAVPRPAFPMTLFGFDRDRFFLQLNAVQADIKKRQKAHDSALTVLESIESSLSEQTHLFIDFINDVLSEPDCLLHGRGLSFVKGLGNAEQLRKTLLYLDSLPQVPAPEKPLPGTFDAMVPINDKQAACISLLRNNSFAFQAGHPCNDPANSLLQNALLIHKDIAFASLEQDCSIHPWTS